MSQKIKILIVEDEALIAQNLRYTLEDLGYEVIDTCFNYKEGLDAITRNSADLIMMDINLSNPNPQHTGLGLARAMQQQGIDKPFIFLTAYNDKETIMEAARLKPSGYLIKPVNTATVFAAIQTAIERHNLQQTDGQQSQPDVDKAKEKPHYFFVKVGTRNIKVLWEDVMVLESGKNYVKIKVADNPTEYPVRGTLTFVMDQLLPDHLQSSFIRINRSTALNRKYITSYTAEWVNCSGERYENTRFTIKEMDDLLSHKS